MIKKLIFPSVLISCLMTASAWAGGPEVIIEPDYFSGFFIGGTGSFHQTAFNGSSSVEAPDDIVIATKIGNLPPVTQTILPAGTYINNTISGNDFAGYYGVQGGVGKVFDHRWYAGFVGFGEWGSGSYTNSNSDQVNSLMVNPNTSFSGQYTSSTTVTISNDYGVAFKPGYLVAPKSMVYGKVGAVWADLTVLNSFNAGSASTITNPATGTVINSVGSFSGSSSNEEKKTGLLLAIGFEQFIYRDLFAFNVEYNYVNYGHVNTSTYITGQSTSVINQPGTPSTTAVTTLVSPVITQGSANARVSTLLGGLSIYFGSHWF